MIRPIILLRIRRRIYRTISIGPGEENERLPIYLQMPNGELSELSRSSDIVDAISGKRRTDHKIYFPEDVLEAGKATKSFIRTDFTYVERLGVDKLLQEHAKIVQFISMANEVTGRKKLQKMIYIAKKMNFPFAEKYELHMYGPYSEELTLRIEELCEMGFLAEQCTDKGSYVQYSYQVTDEGSAFS